MPKKKRIADKNERLPSPMFDMGTMPYIEMLGNRRITVEGSTGILLYDSESIKINTRKTVILILRERNDIEVHFKLLR